MAGKRQKQNHIGNFGNITWDCNTLRTEVESYPDDAKVNWTALAWQFQIRNSNGQIAKNGGSIRVSTSKDLKEYKVVQKWRKTGTEKKLRGLVGKWISHFLFVMQHI